METLAGVLAEHPFIKGLKQEHVDLMVGCARNAKFDAGEYLIREGEAANEFYIIRHGRVNLEIHGPKHGVVTIYTAQDGDVVGWSWLLPPYQWRWDARAMDLTRVIALDALCLRTKCDADPSLGFELVKRLAHVLGHRLQGAMLQLLDLYGEKD